MSDQSWRDTAACHDTDPDLFYPGVGEARMDALAICRTCPVTTACLHEAITSGEKHGIWGGTTPNERHNLTRRARRKQS